jgi:beta-galactosidase
MFMRTSIPLACLCLAACAKPQDPQPATKTFPKGFLWGTSIAGFQADMGCPTLAPVACEDRHSDWYDWVTDEELKKDPNTHLSKHPVSAQPGHWELYEKDFDLAKQDLGNNAFRLSIEWSRLFPKSTVGVTGFEALKAIASADAIAHYHQELSALKGRGLTPLVTLHHYTLPSWIHDAAGCHKDIKACTRRGWLDREGTVREIAKYAAFAAREFGAEIDLWATLNEPFAVVIAGFIFPSADRTNPPGVMLKLAEAKIAAVAMIEAHARMYDAVKENDTADADGDGAASKVGLVYATVPIAPKDPKNRLDVRAAENLFYLYNSVFLNATIKGELDETMEKKAVLREDLKGRMDYLGINYYTRTTVEGTVDPVFPELSSLTTFNPATISVWEDYPKGLYDMALLGKSYNLPVIVTENGFQDPKDDGKGSAGLVPHLVWLQRAARDGARVQGYFYWTLMDNYEWNHGMDIRMGLFAVDPADRKKTRTPRQTVAVYKRIASDNRVPDDLESRFPAPE